MRRRFAFLVGCALAGISAAQGVEAKRYYHVRAATKVQNLAARPATGTPAETAAQPAVQAAAAPAPADALPSNPALPTFLAVLFQPRTAVAPPVPPMARPAEAEANVTSVGRNTPLRDLVARHAAANGVPFPLAHAVIMMESKYAARIAHAGNYGLMQIRAQTARGMGFSGSPAGLLDAETNLRFGMKYLALAYRMAHGDTCGTVMRYQSGVGTTRMNAANRAYCARARAYMAGL